MTQPIMAFETDEQRAARQMACVQQQTDRKRSYATRNMADAGDVAEHVAADVAGLRVVPDVPSATVPPAPTREPLPPFELDGVHPCVVAAHAAVQKWVADIVDQGTRRGRFLTLFGRSGCGKTHLLKMAREELRRAAVHGAQRWNWPKVLARVHDGDYDLIGHLSRLPVLLLDDIGAEYNESAAAAAYSAAKLYEILESREARWTMITTNLSPNDIRVRMDARIASRFFRFGADVIPMTDAEDWSFVQWRKRNQQT